MDDHAESLREALERENDGDGGIEVLKSTLKELEDDQRLHEGSFTDSETAMGEIMQSMKELRRAIAQKDRSIAELLEKSRVAESERTRVDINRQTILGEKNGAIAQIDRDKQHRQQILKNQDESVKTLEQWIEMASSISPRVPVDEGESTASLDAKLNKLRDDLARYNRQYVLPASRIHSWLTTSSLGASRDEIAAEAGKKEAAYLRAMKDVEELNNLAQVSLPACPYAPPSAHP